MGFTLLHHPKLGPDGKGAKYAAPVGSVADYEAKGWEAVDLDDVRSHPSDFDEDLGVKPLWQQVAEAQGEPVVTPEAAPARNASHAVWAGYAKRQGMDPELADATSRDDLADTYSPKETNQ